MNSLDDVLERGVANIIPDKKTLREKLTKEKINIYMGIDPTAPTIHLGHAFPLRKLQRLSEMGHNVTLLIGDFTALIGDTSDKDTERPILTSEEVEKNFQTYKKQAEKILDFSKIKIVHNSDWLKKLSYADILKLSQTFSLNDFISRELIAKRLKSGKTVGLAETQYPMMQGYDSYHLDIDLQIGGTDQTFNMQAGRTLQKKWRNKESFILATEFLIGTDGRKMSKSWGNAIWLNDSPSDIYAKAMSINDDLIINYFTMATNIPLNDILEIEKELRGANPINIKKKLAKTIVSELYSEEDAKNAEEAFENTVQKKQMPEEINETLVKKGSIINADFLAEVGLAASKSEAKRLFAQGGVEVDGGRINISDNVEADDNMIVKVGKRNFVRIKIK